MATTLGTGSVALVTLGVVTTLLLSDHPGHGPSGPRQDLVAPEVPAGLAARVVAGSEGGVQLTWNVNRTDPDLAGYVVYRSDRPEGGFRCITEDPVRTNAYIDAEPPSGCEFFYRVAARDAARNESALSPQIAVRAAPSPEARELPTTALRAGI